MCTRFVVLSVAVAFLVGCGPAPIEPAPEGAGLAPLIPSSASLEGWKAVEGPTGYVPDTLYEYLDGGAERYLGYGFRRLDHVRYQLGDDLLASVTLDVYDMGGELGAFGVYRSVRPSDAEPREWCAEGFRTPTVASAWQGSVYVHCVADDRRPELIEMAEGLVALICDRTPGDATLPAILGSLPPKSLVPWSERYVATDLLGHGFLPGGVLASYQIDGRISELFFSDLGSEAAADNAMVELRKHHSQRGEIVGEVSAIGDSGFRSTDPALGSVSAVRADRFVVGVYGELADDAQDRLLERLVDGLLTQSAPGT